MARASDLFGGFDEAAERLREDDQQLVVASRYDSTTERGVAVLERSINRCEVIRGRVSRCHPGGGRHQRLAERSNGALVQASCSGEVPDRVVHSPWIYRRDLDPAADPHVKKASRLQCPDGFADHRARYAELLAELALRRQRVTWLQPPRDDRLDDLAGDSVRQAGLPRECT